MAQIGEEKYLKKSNKHKSYVLTCSLPGFKLASSRKRVTQCNKREPAASPAVSYRFYRLMRHSERF